MEDAEILPYRAGATELVAWVEERARGRSAVQLREASGRGKGAEGTVATARALGFADGEGELTALGRRFALGSREERTGILKEAMLEFAPYQGILQVLRARAGERITDAQWIETWWATQGYGNSPSNRREGVAAFGRLAAWAGMGRYIPGRRGRATRIEWRVDADSSVAKSQPREKDAGRLVENSIQEPEPGASRTVSPSGEDAANRVSIPLGRGRVARLEVPTSLTAEEKKRLLNLLDLLIVEEED